MVTALTCPWCGAPLPGVSPGQALAVCAYCSSTASIGGVRPTKAQAGPSRSGLREADSKLFVQVIASFKAARDGGATPYDALVTASRGLGPMGETDALARVILALGQDFDAENRTKVVEDPMCMGRLMETYLRALEAVRERGSFEFSLPFFTATGDGPMHFTRTLTADLIAELAARDPAARKKKGFWPFG